MNSLGFQEWKDGFAVDNIPRTLLNGSYHIETNSVSPTRPNQQLITFEMTTIVRVHFKGYRTPADAIDKSFTEAERILADILQPANKLQGPCVKDVYLSGLSVLPLGATNDNAVILELTFNAVTFGKF
jgi:hypothetical protein